MGPSHAVADAATGPGADSTTGLPHPPWLRGTVRRLFTVKGARAVAHTIRKRLPADDAVWVDDFDGDLRFHCHLDEHMANQVYWRGSYSWSQLRVLDTLLSPAMTFVDVGANQGEFSLFAAKRLTSGHVFAFEPMSEMFRRLNRNVEANSFSNVTTVQKGLWDDVADRVIYMSADAFDDGTRHEGLGTLFPDTKRQAAIETIHTTTMDAFVGEREVSRVDVIKIDIEGAELRALQGASETVARFRPTILVEADRGQAEASGIELEALFDHLDATHEISIITRSGRVRPITREDLGAHQNLLCIPRDV